VEEAGGPETSACVDEADASERDADLSPHDDRLSHSPTARAEISASNTSPAIRRLSHGCRHGHPERLQRAAAAGVA